MKSLLPVLVATMAIGWLTPAWAIDLDASLYGKINLSYDWNDPGTNDWTSYVSRIGVKGKVPIGDDLAVIYQIEQEVDVAHGGTERDTLFSTRNSFIGVSGKFGSLMFGAYDTPFKKAQGKIDVFNDQSGDIKSLVEGEIRAKDSWVYHSPEWSGWEVQAMIIPSDSAFDTSKSVSVLYDKDEWSFGFGLDSDTRKNDRTVAKTNVYDAYRTSVRYAPGNWTFGLLLERAEQQNAVGASAQSAYVLSSSYQFNNITLMAQRGNSDIVGNDVTGTNLGAYYQFNKQAKLYLYYWDFDAATDVDTVSLGVEYKF